MSTVRAVPVPRISKAWLYLELTKPDVTFLVVLSTLAGFYLGSRGPLNVLLMLHAVFGTTLVAAGTSALNHYFERDSDARMRRTAQRPLPLGLLAPRYAFLFGTSLVLIGTLYLGVLTNALAAALGLATAVSYLGAYTPLKKRTTLATLIGAFPGAVSPLIGWAAVRGNLTIEAWILYAILFLWQFPHFHAIAWMYREDYARAGFVMLSNYDPEGFMTARQSLLYSGCLLIASLTPALFFYVHAWYFFSALVLGTAFCATAVRFLMRRDRPAARTLFLASILYLPLLLGLLVAARR